MPAEDPPPKRGRGSRSRIKVDDDDESQQTQKEEESGDTTMDLIGFFLLPLKFSSVSYTERYSLSSLHKPFLQVR